MGQNMGDIKDTVKGFFFAYAVKRDLVETLSFLSDDIRWIGSGAVPVTQGKSQVEAVLEAEFDADPLPFNIEYKIEDTRACQQDLAEAFFEIHLNKTLADGEPIDLTVQLSAVCRKEGFLYKISTIHTTAVDNLAEEKSLNSARIAQEAFEELQDHFHEKTMDFLQQSIPGGMIGCYLEPGFPLYFINEQMLQYLGYTEEELMCDTEGLISKCVHPEDLAFVEGAIDNYLKSRDEYEIRYRMLKKSKDPIWVVEHGKKTTNDTGRDVVLRVLFDITETVAFQQEKREQELSLSSAAEEIQNLYDTLINGIAKIACDDEFTLLYANPHFYNMLGYSEEEFWQVTGGKSSKIIHFEDLKELRKALSGKNKEQLHSRMTRRFRALSGEQRWIWVQMEAALSAEEEGDSPVFYCSFTNIDEVRAKEQEYARQQRFLSLLSSSVSAGTLITEGDEKRTFTFVGDDLLSFLGYSRSDFAAATGNALINLVEEEDRKAAGEALELQLNQGDQYQLEYRIFKRDGSQIWIKEKGKRITGESGSPQLTSVLVDITQEKERAGELVKKNRIDPLTGLLNQDFVKQSIRSYLDHKPQKEKLALILVDLDNFKRINDVYGHLQGDRVLIHTADVLRSFFKEDEIIIGRTDGDEFMILLKRAGKEDSITQKAADLCGYIQEAFADSFANYNISVSVGVALPNPDNKATFKELYNTADSALYQSKFSGKNTYRVLKKPDVKPFGLPGDQNMEESEQGAAAGEPKKRKAFSVFAMTNKVQLIILAFTVSGFLATVGGLLWFEYNHSPDTLILSFGLLGAMVLFLLIVGAVIASLHRKINVPIESLIQQCRDLAEDEGEMARQDGDRDLEVLADAIQNYKQRVERVTYLDPMLHIGNRAKGMKDIEELIKNPEIQRFSLFLLDIHDFSKYNDVFSIRTGDEIIRQVKRRLENCFGERLYRTNGDVFLGLTVERKDDREIMEHIHRELKEPIAIENVEIKIQYNLGISHYPSHGEYAVHLIERAQSALNYAKKQTKANVVIYNESITEILRREGEILSLIRKRIAEETLEVWYQPIYDIHKKKFTTAEALLRLREEKGDLIAPYHAILVAEKNDAIGEIGEYVLKAACSTIEELERMGVEGMNNIHVNLSVQQIAQPNFAERTLELIRETGVNPEKIGVEVTETALIQSFDSTADVLDELKNAGMQIALDDFGSGYSSLNYLARLPIDKLKLDRQLVIQVVESGEQMEFIKTIVNMAKIKHMEVIAEGVEEDNTRESIISCGIDYIQGYYFSKPLPREEFLAFLSKQQGSEEDHNEPENLPVDNPQSEDYN